MAASHAECLELCQLAARRDRLLAVYQNRRCAATAAAVEAALNCTCNSVVESSELWLVGSL
jgi:predicted dehydrogenase